MDADPYRERLLELLRQDSYRNEPVTLLSGKQSQYFNPKRTVLSAEGHFLVGWTFMHLLEEHAPGVSSVGGMGQGADPLASAVSTVSYLFGRRIDAFLIRKDPRQTGYIDGPAGMHGPVALLEDVVNSGGSTLIALRRARDAGFKVELVLTLMDREVGGCQTLAKEVPAISVFKFSELKL